VRGRHSSIADPRVVADIEGSGGAADFLAADLSALAEVRGLADAAQTMADRLDILIYKTQVPGLRARRLFASAACPAERQRFAPLMSARPISLPR
jgi:NAD(P)-dependent dehydrogenase (short-subunit alcohol dehydrogenase family)